MLKRQYPHHLNLLLPPPPLSLSYPTPIPRSPSQNYVGVPSVETVLSYTAKLGYYVAKGEYIRACTRTSTTWPESAKKCKIHQSNYIMSDLRCHIWRHEWMMSIGYHGFHSRSISYFFSMHLFPFLSFRCFPFGCNKRYECMTNISNLELLRWDEGEWSIVNLFKRKFRVIFVVGFAVNYNQTYHDVLDIFVSYTEPYPIRRCETDDFVYSC